MTEDAAPFRTHAMLPPARTKPLKIFAAALDRAMGEFWLRLMFASTVKMHSAGGQLSVYWRDDRPAYKQDMLACCPYWDRQVRVAETGQPLPIDYLYSPGDRHPLGETADAFRNAGHADPDIVLVPSCMLEIDLLRWPQWPQFRIPQDRATALYGELESLRLSSNQPHVCIHYREPTYPFRGPTPYRDVTSDEPFLALRDYLIDHHGLTVVRIGHKEMREWPARERFVDLSRSPFMTQATAISLARFCVMTMSGPASIPNAFGVPSMVSNAVGYAASGADPGFLLPKMLIDAGGEPVDLRGLIDNGMWTSELCWQASLRGFRFVDNTLDQLKRGVDHLADMTSSPCGWRTVETQAEPAPLRYDPFRPFCRMVNVRSDLL